MNDPNVTDRPAESLPPGFWEIVLSGGPIGLVILLVLLGLSVATLYLIFDHLTTLRRTEVLPPGLGEAVRQALLRGEPAEAEDRCRRVPSVLAYTLLSGLAEADGAWHQIEKAVEDAMAEQSARLVRRIDYLAGIANIAPMVGLLGTVTGMIFAFRQVAVTQGDAGASDLAEGIYQALVTTVGGLIVAIVAVAAFTLFRNRIDALMAEVAHQAAQALAPLRRRGGRPAAFKSTPSPWRAADGPMSGGTHSGGSLPGGPISGGPSTEGPGVERPAGDGPPRHKPK